MAKKGKGGKGGHKVSKGGATLVLEFDVETEKRLRQLLDKVAKGVSDLTPFFDAVEMEMIDSLTKNFESGGRPYKWHPLAQSTIEHKGSSAILQDRGDLKRSLNAKNTSRTRGSLKIWAGDKKATFHQLVDQDPEDQWTMENERGMPFRPFILFQDEDIKSIENILDKYIQGLGI